MCLPLTANCQVLRHCCALHFHDPQHAMQPYQLQQHMAHLQCSIAAATGQQLQQQAAQLENNMAAATKQQKLQQQVAQLQDKTAASSHRGGVIQFDTWAASCVRGSRQGAVWPPIALAPTTG
jgi:hypothetical protein